MARAASPFSKEIEGLLAEINGHRREVRAVDHEIGMHERAIGQARIRREYLQDLIQATETMIARHAKLAGLRPAARRRRLSGRLPGAAKPVRKARRRIVRRVLRPAAMRVTSQRLAALSVTDAAEQVLKTAGKPIHLKEIAGKVIAGGKVFRTSKPEVSILTLIRKDKRFRNTGKNMWALA